MLDFDLAFGEIESKQRIVQLPVQVQTDSFVKGDLASTQYGSNLRI